jgi:hypothetical protein
MKPSPPPSGFAEQISSNEEPRSSDAAGTGGAIEKRVAALRIVNMAHAVKMAADRDISVVAALAEMGVLILDSREI